MHKRGFTLIELVVTLGIMAIITAVTLSNHTKFGGKVLLRSVAHEMTLVFREAQTYGISVRKSIDDKFNYPYGVHFNIRTPTEYYLFEDKLKYAAFGVASGFDGVWNNTQENIKAYTIGKGYKITKLEVTGIEDSFESVDTLDITFIRPEPDAIIKANSKSDTIYRGAKIELKSPRGDVVYVLVEVSGQISVIK